MGDTDNQLVLEALKQELKSGNMTAFQKYYLAYKPDFLRFAAKYTHDEDLAHDVLHDAFIVLYENVLNDRLTTLSSSLKTYTFSIAKHLLFGALRKQGRVIQTEEVLTGTELPPWTNSEPDERTVMIRRCLSRLGRSCQEVLTLFYYRGFSIEAIMHSMGYKNENTVKAHKSRCLQKLRALMHNQDNNPGR